MVLGAVPAPRGRPLHWRCSELGVRTSSACVCEESPSTDVSFPLIGLSSYVSLQLGMLQLPLPGRAFSPGSCLHCFSLSAGPGEFRGSFRPSVSNKVSVVWPVSLTHCVVFHFYPKKQLSGAFSL